VYSAAKGINYLEEYATKFDTVEIDQWFWSLHGPDKVSLPRRSTATEYAGSVPPHFRFTVKVPNSITLSHFHQKSKKDSLQENPYFLKTELFFRFLETIEPMHALLGPLMLQFEYLNRQKMPASSMFLDRLGEFLDGCPKEFPIGIESRNPNYLDRRYFDLLKEYGAHHVFLQGYYMPPVWEVAAVEGESTSGVSVIRLHGPDRKGMEERSGNQWDRILEPRDGELQSVAELIQGLLSRERDVFLNVNNHYEGSAPLTIGKIREMPGMG
jgi:uncharacterized protein YecE (DUF72 family)